MSKHIKHWNHLKASEKAGFNRKADQVKIQNIAHTQNAIAEHVTRGLLLKERVDASSQLNPVPN
eukprot:717447-Amphidinium_carterae.1